MKKLCIALIVSLCLAATSYAETPEVKGGLVVRIGCSELDALVKLRESERFLVHGLDTNASNVTKARQFIQSKNLYGPISADWFDGTRLPYTDNLVNLLVADASCEVDIDEIKRVLVPGGIALIGGKPIVKPRANDTAEWTHYLGNPDGNAVAQDAVVGKPRHMQWVAGPRWARSHEHMATVSAVVSTGGRIFTILDEGPTESVTLPPKWRLVARDAFNGVLLWKKPIPLWETQLRGFRSGPAHLPRRLVAEGDRVYVTLGYTEPVSQLDAATGEVLQTYGGTDGASEIVLADGVLFVVKGTIDRSEAEKAMRMGQPSPPIRGKSLMALDAKDGKLLWELFGPQAAELMPLTLAVSDGRVVFHNPKQLLCLDAKTGDVQWTIARPLLTSRKAWSSPTVVIHEDIVLSADVDAPAKGGEQISWTVSIGGGGRSGQLIAYSLNDGKQLWKAPCAQIYNAPPDVFVIDGEVWTGKLRSTSDGGYTEIRDVKTGEVTRTFPSDPNRQVGMPHHRCYRNRATSRYVLAGRAGIEFWDVNDGSTVPHNWVRGACQYGVMPANGLVYAPQHSCACYPKAKLNGFNALAAAREDMPESHDGLLEKGPAYGEAVQGTVKPTDWPVFRHDNARSGLASCSIPAKVGKTWTCELSGKLSASVMADGKLYVAGVDDHTLYALDAGSGKKAWAYTTGGRIDSPPTVVDGRVYVGCRDGYVYCIIARDGQLAWRFRAGPEDRRGIAFDQLESVYAVHGSVLEKDGQIIFASGLSSYIDGGIRVYCLDSKTGEQLSVTCINDWDPKTGLHPKGGGFDIQGSLADILSTDGERLFMRHRVLSATGEPQDGTATHLFSPTGFLDSTWWHRTYWVYGGSFGSGWGGWHRTGDTVPSGRILVLAADGIYGFGRTVYPGGNAGQWRRGEFYRFFATSKAPGKKFRWENRLPMQCRAMVLAGETLFVAGPPNKAEGDSSEFKGPLPIGTTGKLMALTAEDGSKVSEYPLSAAPVFDGMIAADDKLYVVTIDGRVTCFAK